MDAMDAIDLLRSASDYERLIRHHGRAAFINDVVKAMAEARNLRDRYRDQSKQMRDARECANNSDIERARLQGYVDRIRETEALNETTARIDALERRLNRDPDFREVGECTNPKGHFVGSRGRCVFCDSAMPDYDQVRR